VEKLAKRGAELIREYFESGGPEEKPWKQLSEVTIKFKGHDIKLIRSEQMKSTIAARQINENTWEYGVFDWKASIHEYGAVIPVTPAIRGYMAAHGFPLKASTNFIHIPARPFMEPSFNRLMQELQEIEETYFWGWY